MKYVAREGVYPSLGSLARPQGQTGARPFSSSENVNTHQLRQVFWLLDHLLPRLPSLNNRPVAHAVSFPATATGSPPNLTGFPIKPLRAPELAKNQIGLAAACQDFMMAAASDGGAGVAPRSCRRGRLRACARTQELGCFPLLGKDSFAGRRDCEGSCLRMEGQYESTSGVQGLGQPSCGDGWSSQKHCCAAISSERWG